MNKLFKQDILEIDIPVAGETNNYTVSLKLEGILVELQRVLKANKMIFDYRTVIQATTKVFNTTDIFVKCTCDDFKYRFDYWSIINNYGLTDSAHNPGPGKGIANPLNDKGKGCKHVLLVLANGDWIMKVASVIKNYINYMDEHKHEIFLKYIFPKIYGVSDTDAANSGLVPEDTNLETERHTIDLINTWAKNRGKYKKGSNVNPVQADKLEKEQKGTV